MNKSPQKGGCWFCNNDTPPLLFSQEFDTYVHYDCIVDRLRKNKFHPEVRIFAKEFNITLETLDESSCEQTETTSQDYNPDQDR